MLPSPSPQFTATAMWGPVLAWCALELLADESTRSGRNKLLSTSSIVSVFASRLRTHFAALGFEGEEAWRVAARIKVLLLVGAGIGNEIPAGASDLKPMPTEDVEPQGTMDRQAKPASAPETSKAYAEKLALPPALWLDPDVRWLCGVHRAEGHDYLIRESYEELLWWLLMPSLLRIAGESAPSAASSRGTQQICCGGVGLSRGRRLSHRRAAWQR